MTIEIQDDQDVPIDLESLKTLLNGCLENAGCPDVELSLLLTGDERMKSLNSTYRGISEATDVLSFPLEDEGIPPLGGILGDIVISVPTARRQAGQAGLPLQTEIEHLAVHGLLHLLGHDHERDGWEDWEIARKELMPHG